MPQRRSPRRIGLLRLLRDEHAKGFEQIYLPGFDTTRLSDYGLTTYDSGTVTAAVKAGDVEVVREHFHILTDQGRAALA